MSADNPYPNVAKPSQSNFSTWGSRSIFGIRNRPAMTVMTPIGSLNMKIHRQLRSCTSRPPMTGPMLGAQMTPRP